MGTFIAGALVAGAVVLVIRSMIRQKKKGKSFQCGGDCANCRGRCH